MIGSWIATMYQPPNIVRVDGWIRKDIYERKTIANKNDDYSTALMSAYCNRRPVLDKEILTINTNC